MPHCDHTTQTMATMTNYGTLEVQESNLYKQWLEITESELSELLGALKLHLEGNNTESDLIQLIGKVMNNFQEYMKARVRLASQDPSPFYAPPWCTTLENSGLWLAGCRPSSFFRLIYALCGLEIEIQLAEFLQGVGNGKLGELSSSQLQEVDKLQRKTIREEAKLSTKMAGLQENMADRPLAEVLKKPATDCMTAHDPHALLDQTGEAMVRLMEEADNLRLQTAKELMGILTPLQAVQFMAASKKLRVCMMEWGKKRDNDHGRSD